MYIVIIDKGEVCEMIKGPYALEILAISAGQRVVKDDSDAGYTCPVTWEVYQLTSVARSE